MRYERLFVDSLKSAILQAGETKTVKLKGVVDVNRGTLPVSIECEHLEEVASMLVSYGYNYHVIDNMLTLCNGIGTQYYSMYEIADSYIFLENESNMGVRLGYLGMCGGKQ